ncbi:MAG: hypothetical protein KY461_03395 [Actinobacteria bacterium]|nr:hypothetical protein [Actinomycetota bacterium]
MSLSARLHLPARTGDAEVLELEVADGAVADIPSTAVAALTSRRDGRDRIRLDGRRIDRRGTAGRVRAGLALVTDAVVAPDVAVLDHLAAGTGRRRAARLLASSPLLRGRGADAAGVLSGGERRVLAVLRAVATDPRAVVLDAAGEGLDPAGLAWVAAEVARWRAGGVAVLLRPGRPEERAWLET